MTLPCDSVDCDQPAVEAFAFRGIPGHVHDCPEHAAILREFCDVSVSAPLVDGACPVPGCLDGPYLGVAVPTPL